MGRVRPTSSPHKLATKVHQEGSNRSNLQAPFFANASSDSLNLALNLALNSPSVSFPFIHVLDWGAPGRPTTRITVETPTNGPNMTFNMALDMAPKPRPPTVSLFLSLSRSVFLPVLAVSCRLSVALVVVLCLCLYICLTCYSPRLTNDIIIHCLWTMCIYCAILTLLWYCLSPTKSTLFSAANNNSASDPLTSLQGEVLAKSKKQSKMTLVNT